VIVLALWWCASLARRRAQGRSRRWGIHGFLLVPGFFWSPGEASSGYTLTSENDTHIQRSCVIGWPIAHSRSPLIHGYWLKRYGASGSYTKQAVPPEEFASFVRNLAGNGFAGANVTVPHKEAAFRLADEVDDAARSVEAANTLWLENGRLKASNTDVYGFLRNLDELAPNWDAQASSRPAVILGAGGAARAVLRGLLDRGFEDIRMINRNPDRAAELARKFNVDLAVFEWRDGAQALKDCQLLVNATSLGMTGAPPLGLALDRLALDGLAQDAVVNDIVYAPLETRLLQEARARGLTSVDGVGMLLHQAVPGFEKWFGVRPEVTAELRSLIIRDIEGQNAGK
jgi:shikimate dehydrogenase